MAAPMKKLFIVIKKMGLSDLKTESSKSITYKSVSNSFYNGSTLMDAQLTFLKLNFLLDHANFNETNQRTGFLTPLNSACLFSQGFVRSRADHKPLTWEDVQKQTWELFVRCIDLVCLLIYTYTDFCYFSRSDISFTFSFQNPYDSFMRKHLEHYGYYTGNNILHIS